MVPGASQTKTTLVMDTEAIQQALQTVARMPDHDTTHHSIGLEIANDSVSLLGRSTGGDDWVRVELTGVKVVGESQTIFFNRQYLTKALRFGLNRIEVIDPISPLRISNGGKQMIVMPISPKANTEQPKPEETDAPPVAEQPETMMPEQTNTESKPSGTATAVAHETAVADKPALEVALAQIEVLRGECRNTIAGLGKLAETLKQAAREQKATEREFNGLRATLRSLQNVKI